MLITSLSIITTIMLVYTTLYFISKVTDSRLNFIKIEPPKNIFIISSGILIAILHIKIEGNLILLIHILIYIILMKYVIELSTEKAFFSTLVIYLMIAIADVLGVVLYSFINSDIVSLGLEERTIIGNIVIITLLYICSYIKPLLKLLSTLIKTSETKIGNIIVITISLTSLIYIMVYYNIETSDLEDLIVNF